MTKTAREGFGVLGIGAAACVACCAGPILAFLGGLSIAGLASTVLVGGAGLVGAAISALAFVAVRRRRSDSCSTSDAPVPVDAPTRRVTTP